MSNLAIFGAGSALGSATPLAPVIFTPYASTAVPTTSPENRLPNSQNLSGSFIGVIVGGSVGLIVFGLCIITALRRCSVAPPPEPSLETPEEGYESLHVDDMDMDSY